MKLLIPRSNCYSSQNTKVGNDQENAQSEKNPTPKTEVKSV